MVKKYYWLKLKNDFFKRHDIRIIEDMANGKDYVLFYLKLLVESVSHEGDLRFSDTVPYNESMLATITNTNIDIVRTAVKVFTDLKLMEMLDDGTIYMNEIQNMVGSETDWAKKKRLYREEQKLLPKTSGGQKKTLSDKSIEKELELEKELKDNAEIQTIDEPKDSPTDIELFFNESWKLYPNKKGKGQIKPARKKVAYSLGEEFKRAIERYKETNSDKDKEYLQYGSTFWNGGYVDYLDDNFVEFEETFNSEFYGSKEEEEEANRKMYEELGVK